MNNNKFYPVSKPYISGKELPYVEKALRDGWISSEGMYVEKFESKFSKYIGKKYGVSVSSGTAALDIAVSAIGLKKNDEVIMPTFTIISCIKEILKIGAKPILVDADEKTWNIDIKKIEKLITKKTKALMIVHTYGLSVDMDLILKLVKKYKLILIEDTAEAHGQYYKNKKCGSFGDISTFSFYANKHLTTGEGGMILTNSSKIYEKCKSLRNLSFGKKERFKHKELSWNYRMSNIQAGIGLAQLGTLDYVISQKIKIGMSYFENFISSEDFIIQPNKTDYCLNHYWVFGIVIKKKIDINKFLNILNKKGIGNRRFFCPMHSQPAVKKYFKYNQADFKYSNYLYRNGFYIPNYVGLKKRDINYISKVIIDTINE